MNTRCKVENDSKPGPFIDTLHDNATQPNLKIFRPMRDSLKADACQTFPSIILDEIEESPNAIMNLTFGIREEKQIYDYKYNYERDKNDDYFIILNYVFGTERW